MSLLSHVKKGDWEALEDEWTELMLAADASTEPVLEALPHAARRRELPRILPLLKDHAEVLAGNGRGADAARLLGAAMLEGGSPGELAKPLYESVEAAYGGESWWAPFCDIAGFSENAPDMRAAWRAFRRLLALKDGKAVYHAKGWGIGAIESLDLDELEVEVRFSSGRRDTFPFTTAVDIFEVLSAEDPRALVVTDPEGLKRMVKEEPLELLRAVVRRHQGQVGYHQLKITMGSLGVDGPAFTAYWRRARKGADESGWFEITGAGTKAQVRLLAAEADPAQSLRRQLERATTFATALQRVRDVMAAKGLDDNLRNAALETLEVLAHDEERDQPRRFAAWMLLRDVRGATPEALAGILAEVAAEEEDEDSPPLWQLFHRFPSVRDQDKAIELLREARGEEWLDDAARNLLHSPPGMARGLVEALDEAGRRDELFGHYGALLLRPNRNPSVLVALVERLERSADDMPPKLGAGAQRATSLLQLATHLKRQPASDNFSTRARTRLTAVLAEGKKPLLPILLDGVETEGLRRLNSLVERGVDREIDRLFTSIVVEIAPEIFRGADRPFWEGDTIWTTRAGLARREEELRILRDIKIPENSEAIGKAASYGDLSENSEWEAAIEEQRNLTQRAQEIEAELRETAFLEDAAIPENTVSPGTRVKIREATGRERELSILGPWDEPDRDDVVSYHSPLAAGMLGLHPGDEATVKLPGGETQVHVLAVRLIDL
ncbi:MAG: GreA/GreB family elongation factor [Planctomycetota bacterium]